jgi:hypothetical protein
MVAFQPAPTDGLYYPSALLEVAPGVYNPADLVENPAGSGLYDFQVGDYAYPSLIPVPHIEATLFTFDPATVTITVYRTAAHRTMPVRGQVNVYAVGGRNVVDWEAPFGIPITYRAEQFDAEGNSLGFTAAFSTQLDVNDTWIQNVFDPIAAVQVTMSGTAAGTIRRPNQVDLYYPSGSGLPVAISGQRQGVTETDVSFLTFTETDADKVRGYFGDPYGSPSVPPVVCIRVGANQNMRLPRPFYAVIADPGEQPLDTASGGALTRWDCTATEVAPPAPVLVAAVLTYEDFDAVYPDTYESEDAAYSSYLEADRDYSIAGTAGEQD